jgi:hypothetical protein
MGRFLHMGIPLQLRGQSPYLGVENPQSQESLGRGRGLPEGAVRRSRRTSPLIHSEGIMRFERDSQNDTGV